jgi:hypothetical protein
MRKGVIAEPTWAGYDRRTGVVRLHSTQAKTRKLRRVVLAGPLAEIIDDRSDARKVHPECPSVMTVPENPRIAPLSKAAGGKP